MFIYDAHGLEEGERGLQHRGEAVPNLSRHRVVRIVARLDDVGQRALREYDAEDRADEADHRGRPGERLQGVDDGVHHDPKLVEEGAAPDHLRDLHNLQHADDAQRGQAGHEDAEVGVRPLVLPDVVRHHLERHGQDHEHVEPAPPHVR